MVIFWLGGNCPPCPLPSATRPPPPPPPPPHSASYGHGSSLAPSLNSALRGPCSLTFLALPLHSLGRLHRTVLAVFLLLHFKCSVREVWLSRRGDGRRPPDDPGAASELVHERHKVDLRDARAYFWTGNEHELSARTRHGGTVLWKEPLLRDGHRCIREQSGRVKPRATPASHRQKLRLADVLSRIGWFVFVDHCVWDLSPAISEGISELVDEEPRSLQCGEESKAKERPEIPEKSQVYLMGRSFYYRVFWILHPPHEPGKAKGSREGGERRRGKRGGRGGGVSIKVAIVGTRQGSF